jgi:hypothetical protein
MSKKYILLILSVIISLILLACVPANKEPAAEAIKAAEAAYNAIKNDAMNYIPKQAKGVENAIKATKEIFDKGSFDEALKSAKAITEKVMVLTTAVAIKKAELTGNWEEISGEVSGMLDVINERLDTLSASKRLPKTLNKAKLEDAKADYEAAAKMWDEARSTFSGGNMVDAIAKAKTVKEKAMAVINNLLIKETPIKS